MSESSNATSLPAPEGGAKPDLNLSIVPPPKRRRSPSALNQGQLADIASTAEICEVSKRADYAPALAANKIPPEFVTTLENDIRLVLGHSDAAKTCTNARKGATASEGAAKETLLKSLRTIQAAARNEFSITDPSKVDNYLVGENIGSSQSTLDAAAQTILNAASADRPGSVNTEFIVRVTGERAAHADAIGKQQTELGKGKQQRGMRNELVVSIVARRKKIQHAADTAWPHHQPTSAEARVLFQLPANRPYSY